MRPRPHRSLHRPYCVGVRRGEPLDDRAALFATVLNWQFLALNPKADGAHGSNAVQRIEL